MLSVDPNIAIRAEAVAKRFPVYRAQPSHGSLKTTIVEWFRKGSSTSEPPPAPTFAVIEDVSFQIPRGEVFGLIGRNGAGKSTLLKLISGVYRPDAGRLVTVGRIASLELGAGFHPDFTGRENVLFNGLLFGLPRREILARLPEIIEFAEIGRFIDAPVRTYSSGMFSRLAFSVALFAEPDILLIDEIFAVGDEAFIRKSKAALERRVQSPDQTTVLVSHDLDLVASLCHRVAVIQAPTLTVYDDPAEAVEALRANMAEELTASTGA
ncbi:MAG: ABC transporter ATP-binding protein [Planctomycetota bacterium]